MKSQVRAVFTGVFGSALLLFALWGFAGVPRFGEVRGPYGLVLNQVATHERKIDNVISAVNFDYRGLDTLGEESILFAAVAGLALVLRRDRRQTDDAPLPAAHARGETSVSEAIPAFAVVAIAVTVAFGIYLAIHPHLSPGGGFQGGTIVAGWFALAFLGLGYRATTRLVNQEATEFFEALGAFGYVAIGLATLASAGTFLANTLPLGGVGELFSTGTIPVINLMVAIEVCAGFMLVFLEFVRETRVELEDGEGDAE